MMCVSGKGENQGDKVRYSILCKIISKAFIMFLKSNSGSLTVYELLIEARAVVMILLE